MINIDESQSSRDVSPGQLLLQGRLQAGLTQEQVAKELYMTVSKVKALETDDYGCMNSDTFARGYIRAYANLLSMDVVPVLAAYDQLMEKIRPKTAAIKPVETQEPQHRGAWQFLLLIGAFFVGLWLISVWFFDNHSDRPYAVAPVHFSSAMSLSVASSSSVVSSPAVAVDAAKSEPAVASSSSAASVVFSSSASSAVSEPRAKSSASSAETKTVVLASMAASTLSSSLSSSTSSVTSSVKKTGLDEITFSFRAESWLEVSDSRGDVLVTELQAAGSKLKLVGQAPFDVKLGNAPAVEIQLNSKKIDVIPLMGTNVLTLKVGAQ